MTTFQSKVQPTATRSLAAVHVDLPLIQQGEKLLISAFLLHKKLGVKTRFNDWFQRRIDKYGFEINIDFYSNLSKSKTRPVSDYLLSLDMAKELAMLEENEIGRAVRRYFIEKEKELRGVLMLPAGSELLKGLKPLKINGRVLYPYREVPRRCGYSAKSSGSHRKARYWMHFVLYDNLLYITKEFALHLYHQMQLMQNRKALPAAQPVLPLQFGDNSLLTF
ncbi:MAG: antA/AntB antirepressor family protein [Chitinophagaceae bacterium]|nr:antA/AntB antirepressor family protein [Chitinophagaceae bacterium]